MKVTPLQVRATQIDCFSRPQSAQGLVWHADHSFTDATVLVGTLHSGGPSLQIWFGLVWFGLARRPLFHWCYCPCWYAALRWAFIANLVWFGLVWFGTQTTLSLVLLSLLVRCTPVGLHCKFLVYSIALLVGFGLLTCHL